MIGLPGPRRFLTQLVVPTRSLCGWRFGVRFSTDGDRCMRRWLV